MVAVKANEVEGALRRRGPATAVLLFYGPDAGLIAERARAAAESGVDDPADPFQLVRLDGDTVADDPGRLVDEAGTMGLFGGRRAIWVRPTSRNLAPAADALLGSAPLRDTLVVIEAPDLTRTAPLTALCERSPHALALPCYADREEALGAMVDATLRENGLAIGREARGLLLASLGGDRLATRAELAKLMLYAHGCGEITVADVEAVVSDVSALALDSVIDAAFAGSLAAADVGFRRVLAEGTSPTTLLTAALGHALALSAGRADLDAGKPVDMAMRAWRRLHFTREPLVKTHLRLWNEAALLRTVDRLQADALDARRMSGLAAAIAGRRVLDIAATARRLSRRR
jgi:DNA polymerase III subunit delta